MCPETTGTRAKERKSRHHLRDSAATKNAGRAKVHHFKPEPYSYVPWPIKDVTITAGDLEETKKK